MKRITALMLLTAIVLPVSASFGASSMPQHARVLLAERDHLQQMLLRADQDAADALLRGEDPIELYADQTGLQEQVDMMQLRIESLAMRLDFDIPALSSSIDNSDPADVLESHISIGRQRAQSAMANRCQSACGSILEDVDFDSFLSF